MLSAFVIEHVGMVEDELTMKYVPHDFGFLCKRFYVIF